MQMQEMQSKVFRQTSLAQELEKFDESTSHSSEDSDAASDSHVISDSNAAPDADSSWWNPFSDDNDTEDSETRHDPEGGHGEGSEREYSKG